MACFSPLLAWQTESGEIVFAERGNIRRELNLPCGQCIGCRLERSRQWAVRCVHESQMWPHSVFITLTYDDDHVPHDFGLNYKDYQLFMRRLRKYMRKEKLGRPRFYMCGEYGEQYGRPHFHAALFNVFFPDREVYRVLESGSTLYTSKTLQSLWPFGFSSIGDVTFESAAYIARYVMKKVTGSRAESHYEAVDGATGEIYQRKPEFTRMSLKPGIGQKWFEKYLKDMYPRDYVVMRGQKMKIPKYYDRLLKERGETFETDAMFDARIIKFRKNLEDCTVERLAVRETVAKARSNLLKRKL